MGEEEKPGEEECSVCALPAAILAGINERLRGDKRPKPVPPKGVCGWLAYQTVGGAPVRIGVDELTTHIPHIHRTLPAVPLSKAYPTAAMGDAAVEYALRGQAALSHAAGEVGAGATPFAYVDRSDQAGRPLTGEEFAQGIIADEHGLNQIFGAVAKTLMGVSKMLDERVVKARAAATDGKGEGGGNVVTFPEAMLLRGLVGSAATVARVRHELKTGRPGAADKAANARGGLKGLLAGGPPPSIPGDNATVVSEEASAADATATPAETSSAASLLDDLSAELPPASGEVQAADLPSPAAIEAFMSEEDQERVRGAAAAEAAGVGLAPTAEEKWGLGIWAPGGKRRAAGGGGGENGPVGGIVMGG